MEPQRAMPADELNPYAPPECPDRTLPDDVEWPPSGIFADGLWIVIHHEQPWPRICLRTLEPADAECPVELYCLGANDGSCPQALRRSFHTSLRSFQFKAPVTAQWLGKHRIATRIARALLATGFVQLLATLLCCGLAMVMRAPPGEYLTGWITIPLFAVSLVFLSIGSILQETWKPLRQIDQFESGYLWISGARRDYLQRLPPWPRKPAFWNRFLGI